MDDFKDLLSGRLSFDAEDSEGPEEECRRDAPPSAGPAGPPEACWEGESKYRVIEKIGEGGAGEVLLVEDRIIERTVALKRIKEERIEKGARGDLLGRFLFEARITGKLDHPGIVPVHEIGRAKNGMPYYTMRRLEGKTLAVEIDEARRAWPGLGDLERARIRMRFLQAFISAANAVAFAHSRGVIHRDLKPSNIVLGGFGEAYVIDWGLAKVLGGGREDAQPAGPGSAEEFLRRTFEEIENGLSVSDLTTISGVLKGTPAFMSPEQAAGYAGELDERSDIYSLGAVLYQILAFVPPVEGGSVLEVLSRIQSGDIVPPGLRAPGYGIPAELEAIAMKALSLRRGDRFESAVALRAAVEAFLEGSERRRQALSEADRLFREGKAHGDRFDSLARERAGLRGELRRASDDVQYHDPIDRKRPLWRMLDRIREAEIESARAFTDAVYAFTSALNHAPDHAPSREALCAIYWSRFVAAEEAEETKDIVHFKTLIERYDTGAYAERLRGDGVLSVATAAYPCRCLQDGRDVPSGELAVEGYHPVSGRHFTLVEVLPGMPALEPAGPVRLRVHGPDCRPEPLPGADVWLFRYEERDRMMVPVFPAGVSGHGAWGTGHRLAEANSQEEGEGDAGTDQELQGPGSVAGSDGSVRGDLSRDGNVSERGDVRNMGTDQKGRDIGAEQHRGRLSEDSSEGVRSVPGSGPRISGGSRHSGRDLQSFGASGGGGDGRPELQDRQAAGKDSETPGEPEMSAKGPSDVPRAPCPVPRQVLDRLYAPSSPFRPTEGLYLGKTPVLPFEIPMGSYMLIIAYSKDERVKGEGSKGGSIESEEARTLNPPPSTLHPDAEHEYAPVRLPVRIGRLETKEVSATLYPEGVFPPGFRLVSGGFFPFQGEKNNPNSGVAEVLETEDVLISTFPVTCAEYLEYLDELASSNPAAAAARVPRESDYSGFYWPLEEGGRYAIPTAEWLSTAAPETRARARRLLNATKDWEVAWPVAGVSWEDAVCFAARRTRREGFLIGLPLEAEWEKAARGADGRVFSWGNHMDGTFCNMNKSRENAMHPVRVDSFPLDESPYGVRGLSGNVATPCLDGPGRMYPQWRYFRGGSWGDAGLGLHATSRRSRTPDAVYHLVGIRLCARLRVGGTPRGCARELSLSMAHRRSETG